MVQTVVKGLNKTPGKAHLRRVHSRKHTGKTIRYELGALFRLNTEGYESTDCEHLYSLLVKQGTFFIDGYGGWKEAKKTVNEFFRKDPVYMDRVDGTARTIHKL